MKKIFSLMVAVAALAMVGCCGNKKAAEGENVEACAVEVVESECTGECANCPSAEGCTEEAPVCEGECTEECKAECTEECKAE